MKRIRIISVILLFVFVICTIGINRVVAKSVYAITDHEASKLKAYKIDGYQLEYQADVNVTDYANGAVGVTIDSNLKLLFITYEDVGKIVWANAKTLQQEGFIDLSVAPCYAGNFAGVVADEAKQKVYVVERESSRNRLFILAYSTSQKKLILMDPQNPNQPYSQGSPYVTLTGLPYGTYAWGIALDENTRRLYVSNNTTNVHIYNANDPNWTHLGTRDVGRVAMGIAIDPNNGQHPAYLYIGGFQAPGGGFHTLLVKHDLEAETNPNTEQNIGTVATGLAVETGTGLVYVTTSNWQVRVYDCSEYPFTCTYAVSTGGTLSGPAGVCVPSGDVSYKEPFTNLTLVKEDNIADYVVPGNKIIYTITYSSNGVSDSNVVITDYLPIGVDPNNLSDLNYDGDLHKYTWQIVTPSDSNSFTLEVVVNEVEPLGTITNYCEMEGDLYCSFASVVTNVGCYGGDIIYVDGSAFNGFNIGTSWENAYVNLQDALARASSGCGSQIWVAGGTYKPTNGSTRSISFEMIDDVNIYGGFPPGGGSRNPGIYQTILSGDIDNDDNPTYNSYHVIKCENINNAILDGFTITGGNANASDPDYRGGGIYIYHSSPTIKNCIFSNNSAFYYGGGMYNDDNSSPTIESCIFSNNSGRDGGGGMFNRNNSNANITNCIFYGNKTTVWEGHGGGIYNYYSSPTITNCTLSSNSAPEGFGGGMYSDSSNPNVTNCIFWENSASYCNEIFPPAPEQTVNYCDIQGGWSGTKNIDKDPCFVDANSNNYHIAQYSPCIDEGNNLAVPLWVTTDIDGQGRIIDDIVDIGADEYYWNPPDFSADGIVNFIDYAIFTTAWLSSDSEYSLDEDNDVDYDDLALFCEDWMTVAVWYQPMEFMMMGDGLDGGMGQGVFLTGFGKQFSTEYTGEVYQPEPVEEQQSEPPTQQEIEDTLKWLDEVWLYPEVRESTSEEDWLEFVELVKLSLQ